MTRQDLILTIAIIKSIKELLEENKIKQAQELIDSYLNSLTDVYSLEDSYPLNHA